MSGDTEFQREMRDCIKEVRDFIADSKVRIHSLERTCDMHNKEMYGADAATPGIKTTLDRIVQKEKNREWAVRAIGAGVIGLGLERLKNYLTGH